MAYLLMNRPERKSRTVLRKVAGGGLAAAILAGFFLGLMPDPTDEVAQKQRPTDVQHVRFDLRQRISPVPQAPAEPLISATADDSTTLEAVLTNTAEFTTTQSAISDLPPTNFAADWTLPTQDAADASPSTQRRNTPRPPSIAKAPPGGSGRPSVAGTATGRPPATGGNPGPGRPTSGEPSSPTPFPEIDGPELAGHDAPSVPGPVTPPVTSVPDTSRPDSNGPDAPIASIPDTPTNGPAPVNPTGQPTGPVIASNEPGDDWFSPGHSPGSAVIDDDFTLDGGTLLFEILGTQAGLEYDQLIVNGNVDLNEGNVVIAFIDNFVPQASDLFELILADLIKVSGSINFYYGFFDPAVDPLWSLHAPTNLNMYTQWDINSGISMGVSGQTDQTGERFTVQYDNSTAAASLTQQGPQTAGPNEDVQPLAIGAEVPIPAPLLLIAAGVLFTGTFRRKTQGA